MPGTAARMMSRSCSATAAAAASAASWWEQVFLKSFLQQSPCSPLEDSAELKIPARRWPLPPIRTSSRPCSSPAATSAGWPCAARSTTWPWPGARPLWLAAGFILEEGLPIDVAASRSSTRCGDGRRGRRGHRHRRHQGGRPRQGRRAVHQHPGIGLGAGGRRDLRPAMRKPGDVVLSAATWATTASP